MNDLCEKLEDLFLHSNVSKNEIIIALKEYLINFEHIETGKSLEEKM